jgi:glycosyltransferase involved in cell wall biosynthesis
MNGSAIKVLHFSSHDEDCGVAKYQEQYLSGMQDEPSVFSKFFYSSPYKTRLMSDGELQQVLNDLKRELVNYDILHIQHEFAFFSGDEFAKIVNAAREVRKKVVVTLHTSLEVASKPVPLNVIGPRSGINYMRDRLRRKRFLKRHVEPLKKVDLILAHNQPTIDSAVSAGVPARIITKLEHPVPLVSTPPPSNELKKALSKQKGDVLFCIVGFLHRQKGVAEAIKSLKYLPPNYKLAVIGGLHPIADDIRLYDQLADLIVKLDLRERVYITGFIKEDEKLNALIQECEVCVYPYDKVYYGNVSSGSLNLAFGNGRAAIAYPTNTFKNMAEAQEALVLCSTFSYYELAKELKRIDIERQSKLSKEYAEKMSWPKMSKELIKVYRKLVTQ